MSDPKQTVAQTASSTTGQSSVQGGQEAEDFWVESIQRWFPGLHEQTYFVPYFFVRRVPYKTGNIEGLPHQVQVLEEAAPRDETGSPSEKRKRKGGKGQQGGAEQPIQQGSTAGRVFTEFTPAEGKSIVFDSDVRDDWAQEFVLASLQDMADKQRDVMIVVSQLKFGKYLREPAYAAAAAHLPKPITCDKSYKQGEFDILMIHRHHGILVGEVKSIGLDLKNIDTPAKEAKAIVKRLDKAVDQLNKARKVLEHLVSDVAKIQVTPTVILPYLTHTQLSNALETNKVVLKKLCDCLGVEHSAEAAVRKCLCKDRMPPVCTTHDVTADSIKGMSEWWENIIRDDPAMTSDIYERLVARFCGPATTVDIPVVATQRLAVPLKSRGQAAAETGRRIAQLTLLPQQVNLINSGESTPRVFLAGPPGTGKTVVLVLVGGRWFIAGHDVHLLASWEKAHAAVILIEEQLNRLLHKSGHSPKIYPHFFDFADPDKGMDNVRDAVETLKKAAVNGELYVIADEAGPDDSNSTAFQEFCEQLNAAVPDLHLWAAAVQHGHKPDCLQEERLTVPLRCPPAVVKEVEKAPEFKKGRVHAYTAHPVHAPTDGPDVCHLEHVQNDKGHADQLFPKDCEHCGEKIAKVLKDLDVREAGHGALQYRDVLVLCHDPHDDRQDRNGHVTSQATPVIAGLRQSGLPVRVVQRDDANNRDLIRSVALATSDEIVVTDYMLILGLERRVVVGVGHVGTSGVYDKLLSTSRCTGQLVWVATPHHVHGEEGGGHHHHHHHHHHHEAEEGGHHHHHVMEEGGHHHHHVMEEGGHHHHVTEEGGHHHHVMEEGGHHHHVMEEGGHHHHVMEEGGHHHHGAEGGSHHHHHHHHHGAEGGGHSHSHTQGHSH